MKEAKDQQIALAIKVSDASSIPPIYANHSMINVNPFEANILFSYVDALEIADALLGEKKQPQITGKPVAKIILSHKAVQDLAKNLSNLLARMEADGKKLGEEFHGEAQEKKA